MRNDGEVKRKWIKSCGGGTLGEKDKDCAFSRGFGRGCGIVNAWPIVHGSPSQIAFHVLNRCSYLRPDISTSPIVDSRYVAFYTVFYDIVQVMYLYIMMKDAFLFRRSQNFIGLSAIYVV